MRGGRQSNTNMLKSGSLISGGVFE